MEEMNVNITFSGREIIKEESELIMSALSAS